LSSVQQSTLPGPIGVQLALRASATLVAAGLVTALFIRFGFGPYGFMAAFVASALVILSLIDIEQRRLPNRIVLPSIVVVLAAQAAFFPERLVECTIAAIGAALFLLLPGLVLRGGVGMGDVKLALLLGAALGQQVVAAVCLAAFASLPAGLIILARAGLDDGRRKTIPFGPFLAAGGIVALFLASP
jgi:leader peptidase (prepilin peptidase)/N-methyltransferase